MHVRRVAQVALAAALTVASPPQTVTPTPDRDLAPSAAGEARGARQPAGGERAADRARPDRISVHPGGIAARLRVDGDVPVPGELYMLMATPGSHKLARVYDETPYVPAVDRELVDTARSNLVATELASELVGHPLARRSLTSAPGGGPSAGLAYVMGYLNIDSAGAYTSDVAVAATGELQPSGRLVPILGADEKLTAALLARVDVLFTPSLPDADLADMYTARIVGDEPLVRPPIAPGGRAWERYRAWGATSPDEGLDLVVVHHLGEVAAYLCGAGSQPACESAVHLAGPTGPWSAEPAARVT